MPEWNKEYVEKLRSRFQALAESIDESTKKITEGRVAPALDDIPIGGARYLRGAALYFDIRGFTKRTRSPELTDLRGTLVMLNAVIPTIMSIIYDLGGYVEKNTGDGVMALCGLGEDDKVSANLALDVAVISFYALEHIVNPALVRAGYASVEARIGIDVGNMLIARIGTHSGSSAHQRNFLTAVGPAANIACKLQGKAGTNEIWVGNLVKNQAHDWRQKFFEVKDSGDLDWDWFHHNTTQRYHYWRYNAYRLEPTS